MTDFIEKEIAENSNTRKPMKEEEKLYDLVLKHLRQRFVKLGFKCHLEKTANGIFSEFLKIAIKDDIVFSFLKRKEGGSPDITGYVGKSEKERLFVVVEVKNRKIKLSDIYQIKRYAELFRAEYAFLLSTELIPEEVKRLVEISPGILLSYQDERQLYFFFRVYVDSLIQSPKGLKKLKEDPFFISKRLLRSFCIIRLAMFSDFDGEIFDNTWYPDHPFQTL